MSEQKDLFVLSVLLWDYFLYMGEAGKASPWTLSEVLLMVFQRRVSLSDYEDMFFSSVSLLFWLEVRGSSFTSDPLVAISAVCTSTTTPGWTETLE